MKCIQFCLNTYSRYLFTLQDFQNTFKGYGLGYEKKIEYDNKILEYIIYTKEILEYI